MQAVLLLASVFIKRFPPGSVPFPVTQNSRSADCFRSCSQCLQVCPFMEPLLACRRIPQPRFSLGHPDQISTGPWIIHYFGSPTSIGQPVYVYLRAYGTVNGPLANSFTSALRYFMQPLSSD